MKIRRTKQHNHRVLSVAQDNVDQDKKKQLNRNHIIKYLTYIAVLSCCIVFVRYYVSNNSYAQIVNNNSIGKDDFTSPDPPSPVVKEELQTFTNQSILQYQIQKGIQFMCMNQYSNGQFTYQLTIQKHNKQIINTEEENNMVRQSGGLYALGMYYRDIQHDNNLNFSIEKCLTENIKYLQNNSVEVIDSINSSFHGQLIAGNTGATSLGILGILEVCIAQQNDNGSESICCQFMQLFMSWIKAILVMRNNKLTSDPNYVNTDTESTLELFRMVASASQKKYVYSLSKGAFIKKKSSTAASAYYDSEAYLALSRVLQYKDELNSIGCFDGKFLWSMLPAIIQNEQGLDLYFNTFRNEDNAHWIIQAWFNRYNVDRKDVFIELMIEKMKDWMKTHRYRGRSGQCHIIEAAGDLMYILDNDEIINSNPALSDMDFRNELWNRIGRLYRLISVQQLFENQTSYDFFKSQYDGAFLSRVGGTRMRIDDTQHCVCALIKIYKFLFEGDRYVH